MSKLLIYADESGTMPLEDKEEYFLTAAISYIDKNPEISMKDGHLGTLLKMIKDSGGIPSISYLKSFKGFKNQVLKKVQEINKLSKISYIFTRNNSRYYHKYGQNPGNWIWIHCMGDSISRVVLKNILLGNIINEISIYFDRKSLKNGTKLLLEDNIKKIRGTWIEFLKRSRGVETPKKILMARESDIHINWINIEKEYKPIHKLASFCYEALRKNKLNTFKNKLNSMGLGVEIIHDITHDIILAPLDKRIKENLYKNLSS